MLKAIVKRLLRIHRIRQVAVSLLATEIFEQSRNPHRVGKLSEHHPRCKDCLFFPRICGSRNVKGWCKKFVKKEVKA